MKLRTLLFAMAASASLFVAEGCKNKPEDAGLQSKVETAIANPQISVQVKDAMATLSGSVNDSASKNAAETAAKSVEGIAGVTNAIIVAVPIPEPAPVIINEDASLDSMLAPVIKDYKNVKASVKNGIITLTGNIKRNELAPLMQSVMALRPKSVDNKLTIK